MTRGYGHDITHLFSQSVPKKDDIVSYFGISNILTQTHLYEEFQYSTYCGGFVRGGYGHDALSH